MSDSSIKSLNDFLAECKVQVIINQDDTLSDYIREMKVFILRGGNGLFDDELEQISDHIEMLKAQSDKHPVLEEQIEVAENLFSQCDRLILAIDP